MKKVKVYKKGELELRPYIAHSFNQNEDILSSMVSIDKLRDKCSKKEIRKTAEKIGIDYNAEMIKFAKKVMYSILDEVENGK